ncbi:hypothetical protein [Paraburkholderia hayleyella]|uniref:hypothetical protein n=1 Tax=Paraburkholderia hayleyella TaxID=2152889 RepID=UPI001291AC7D|nr:hypothetical protein [Paraburkholderia hayleyella]
MCAHKIEEVYGQGWKNINSIISQVADSSSDIWLGAYTGLINIFDYIKKEKSTPLRNTRCWASLRIWRDGNRNAATQDGELLTLTQLAEIFSMSLCSLNNIIGKFINTFPYFPTYKKMTIM